VVAVDLGAKVRYTAGELYGQAKARYAASDTMRKAGQQAGQAASRITGQVRDLSGKAAFALLAGKIRDLSAKAASGPMAGKIRDLSGKAAAAVKDAQARGPEHR
jgi:hypothetical protein